MLQLWIAFAFNGTRLFKQELVQGILLDKGVGKRKELIQSRSTCDGGGTEGFLHVVENREDGIEGFIEERLDGTHGAYAAFGGGGGTQP